MRFIYINRVADAATSHPPTVTVTQVALQVNIASKQVVLIIRHPICEYEYLKLQNVNSSLIISNILYITSINFNNVYWPIN